jgi:TolB-like protein/class 3 adenylate cyclase/Tfp pilus assembly protein PilF
MFTDVVGYTMMAQADESGALERLKEHRELIRPILALHQGVEIKTMGDAFLVEFPSALEAVRCSVDIQQAIHDRNASVSEGRRLLIRVGVHVGDVVHEKDDILGDAVNVSSRIEPLAEPGGVCISQQVYDHVRNKLAVPLQKLDAKTLKNVKLPIDVYRLVMPWESEVEEHADLDAKRVAVLPLRNLSPDPNDEYFADGMTEELITAVSSVTELAVIARTSVMQYKGSPKRIAEIARELNTGTLIEGSVRKAGNKVRITVQLIDGSNEAHIWAQNYDKPLDDIFAIQSEVAAKVADTLKLRLVESKKERLERGPTRNTEAYTLYLRGIFYWNKRTTEGLRRALEFYEQSVKLDPTFALGYAGSAVACSVIASNYLDDPEVYYPRAKEYALKALSIDDDLAEAHTVLASVATGLDHDLDKAEAEFSRAHLLNPSYATAHQWHAQLLAVQNKMEEAFVEINRALELSPLSLVINSNVADGYYYQGKYDKGIEQAMKVIDMDPSFWLAYPSLAQLYLAKSMFDEALQVVNNYSKGVSQAESKLWFAYVYATMGRRDESLGILEEITPTQSKEHLDPYMIAQIYFRLENRDKGFEWLEKTYAAHNWHVYSMWIDREFDGVKQDPRYLAMLDKIGLAGHLRK